ncbi:MAG TPA: hypothetical protein VEN28_14280 [Burkholderiaceae bacterium]|nr:hypothetical protein [Burkholderiaceae bacterium]
MQPTRHRRDECARQQCDTRARNDVLCMLSSVVSTSRATVKIPSRKTAGSTIAANGINTSAEPERNPIATSELESAMTYNVLRADASEYVELFAV